MKEYENEMNKRKFLAPSLTPLTKEKQNLLKGQSIFKWEDQTGDLLGEFSRLRLIYYGFLEVTGWKSYILDHCFATILGLWQLGRRLQ